MFKFAAYLILCLFWFWGCEQQGKLAPQKEIPQADLAKLDESQARQWASKMNLSAQGLHSWTELRPGLERSLEYVQAHLPQDTALQVKGCVLTWEQLSETLQLMLKILPRLDRSPELLARFFDWYAPPDSTLITGYYEPLIEASLSPDSEYIFPLYGVPEDLKTVELGRFHPRWQGEKLIYRIEDGEIAPYWDRRQIDGQGQLQNKGLEIAWAKDLVDIFFLQIQGSGRLFFPDGSSKHILYAGKNGHQYVSLGRELIERGHLSKAQMSMQSIKTFLNSNPDLRQELLNTNPSYVFFRLDDSGPYGAMGRVLTPMVSLASDPELFPLGTIMALDLSLPGQENQPRNTISLGLAQDKGGAIKNNHLDLFCGSGKQAEYTAGHLKVKSKACMLVIKELY